MMFDNITEKNVKVLICDVCESDLIVETKEGYVCQDCGVVLDILKLEYNRPYNEDTIQHSVGLGSTQIGSKMERLSSARSMKLMHLNKLQSIKDNENAVLAKARIEINRILTGLNVGTSYSELIFTNFKKLREKLRPGTKYRSVNKLVPITIYFTLKLQNISINKNELMVISNISKKEFNYFLLQLQNFMPRYAERSRKKYIEQKILEITEHFELDMDFFYTSKKIMLKFWEAIKATKDDVIAGLTTSITALCLQECKVKISAICEQLGIKMSTIQSQVQKNIIGRFQVKGFTSLVKSSDLLRKIMMKMDLIESLESIEEMHKKDAHLAVL